MTGPIRPTSELVSVAWLKGVAGLPSGQVGTTLPSDVTKWPNGFVQARVVGGTDHMDLPVRQPVIRVSCWVPGSKRFGEANVLADTVVAGTRGSDGHGQVGREVAINVADFAPARVLSVWPLSTPVRVPDPSDFARYDVTLELHWVPLVGY